MEKESWVLECAAYIETHLKEELSVESISAWAGYSPWYFSRCFKDKMGVSLMEYVKQRRLFAAAGEIHKGKRIIDAALDYGWETHGGFTKAFLGQFGYSPVLLRASYIHDASVECSAGIPDVQRTRTENRKHPAGIPDVQRTWTDNRKGGCENMGLYLKMAEPYKEPKELWEILCLTLEENGVEYNQENIKGVYEMASLCHKEEKRYSGEAYITHPLNTAIILADMGADEETVCAGLLHDAKDSEYAEHLKETEAGRKIWKVLLAFREFERMHECEDERGALVALADRLHNMRTIEFVDPSTWKKRAEDTMKIFSPIAAKYGDLRLRSELDGLSLKRLSI